MWDERLDRRKYSSKVEELARITRKLFLLLL